MPFESPRQRRFMHARHPEIAARWEAEAKRKGVSAVKGDFKEMASTIVPRGGTSPKGKMSPKMAALERLRGRSKKRAKKKAKKKGRGLPPIMAGGPPPMMRR